MVVVLLDGEDQGFGSRSQGPIFVPEESLHFSGVFGALSHCHGLFLHDLAPEFGWQEVHHEGNADRIQHVVVDHLVGGVALVRRVVARCWGVRPCQGFPDYFEGVDNIMP